MSTENISEVSRDTVPSRVNEDREEYFRPHECTLASQRSKYGIRCGRVRGLIFDLTTINFNDVRARSMFKSYASLSAERYRHFTKHPLAIHPFSKLRFWVEVVVFISVAFMKYLMPFWVSRAKPSVDNPTHLIILFTEVIYVLINIPVNALTGYIDGKNSQNIVLDKFKILKHYLCTWMIVDSTALLCVFYELLRHEDQSHTHVIPVISAITELQRLVLFCYANNICTVLKIGMSSRTALDITLFLTSFLSWNIVFQFAIEYYMEDSYRPTEPRACSWLTIAGLWDEPGEVRLMYSLVRASEYYAIEYTEKSYGPAELRACSWLTIGRLWDEPGEVWFMYSLVRAVEMLRQNSNFNFLLYDGCFEIFTIISFIVAQCLILHCSFKYMLALFGSQSSKMKYYIMSQQVQTYMDHRRFPSRIKKKILKFYAIRFRSHFFVESTMLDCVSGQLHEDIIMHTGRQLVREVTFLKQLPWSVLIEISLKFELAIFIEGDIIYKIHTVGDRMYFINKGTVAVYSESGCELMHFDDGDHFGEITLMTRHKQRFVTAVAVTNCELFSLSRENFGIVERYRTAYDELRKTGVNRVQWIKMMDDQYKAQLKDWSEAK